MKNKKYYYEHEGIYRPPMPGGRAHHIWIIKNPQGREIAEAIGEGTAKKIVQALNAMENK